MAVHGFVYDALLMGSGGEGSDPCRLPDFHPGMDGISERWRAFHAGDLRRTLDALM